MIRLLALYDRLLEAMAVLAAAILVVDALLITADVAARNLALGFGIPGVIELTEYGLYLVTVLAAPWALRLGAHVAVEIVVDALPETAARSAEKLSNLVGLGVSLALLYAGSLATWKSFDGGRLVYKTFIFPEWWLLIALPFCALILAIEFIARLGGIRAAPRDPLAAERGAGGG
ncbi:MAG: TRAP transporter small permease [Rhodovibrionaceae bacterium]